MKRWIIQGICVASLALCWGASAFADTPKDTEAIKNVNVGDTPNMLTTGEQIYFGGQPAAADFALFKERGVKTVINFRSEEEVKQLSFDEKALVEDLGMKYVHVPLRGGALDDKRLRRVVEAIAETDATQVLIHCASGNRVGFAWSLFLGTEQGENVEEAIARGEAVGMRSEELEARARAFLEDVGPTWEKLPRDESTDRDSK